MTDHDIDQLYCTHCTHGTSALHRHTGNMKDIQFEYSARAASVDRSECHRTFQDFEKQFFAALPMPSDDATDKRLRERLNAETCPWRRLFSTRTPNGNLLAHVVYRTHDTSTPPRVGSYFAHLLLQRSDAKSPKSPRWSHADAMKMWGAGFWRKEDSSLITHDLEKVAPPENLDGFSDIVNDTALRSFLTTPPGEKFDDGPVPNSYGGDLHKCAIPERWRNEPVSVRQEWFAKLFHSVVALNFERRERLLVAVEPSLAALLFYGVLRLLPRTGLVDQLSVSTFEPHTEPTSIVLAATDFHDTSKSDHHLAAARGAITLNTYGKLPDPVKPNEYFSRMFEIFISSPKGGDEVDEFLADFERLRLSRIEDCEQYLSVDNLVDRFLQSETPNPGLDAKITGLRLEAARQRFRQTLLQRLKQPHRSDLSLTLLCKSRSRIVTIVMELFGAAESSEVSDLQRRICREVPADDIADYLNSSQLPYTFRSGLVKHAVESTGKLPNKCDFLWESQSHQSNEQPLLEKLFKDVNAEHLERFCHSSMTSVSKTESPYKRQLAMLRYLAKPAVNDRAKRDLLTASLPGEKEMGQWEALLGDASLRVLLFEVYPVNADLINDPLITFLEEVRYGVRPFHVRVEILRAAGTRIPEGRREELACFVRFREQVLLFNDLQKTPPSFVNRMLGATGREIQAIAENLVNISKKLDELDPWGDPTKDVVALLNVNCNQGQLRTQLIARVRQLLDNKPKGTGNREVKRTPEKRAVSLEQIYSSPITSWSIFAVAVLAAGFILFQFRHLLDPTGQEKLAKNEGTKLEAAKTETTKAETAKPKTTKTETAKTEGAKTEGAKTEGAKTEGAKTEGAKPEGAKPEGAKPEGTKPEGTKPAPKAPATKPMWMPDKLYIAETDSTEFNVARRFWKFENPVDFLTFHGPSVYDSDDVPKEFNSKKHVPLIRRWKDQSTIEVFAAIPKSDGVVVPDSEQLVWTIHVGKSEDGKLKGVVAILTEPSATAWNKRESAEQSRIEASLRNCAIGIHTGKDTTVLAVERKKPDSSLAATLTKDSEVQFDLPSAVEIPTASRYIFSLDGNSAIRFAPTGEKFHVGDAPKNLYSTEWTLLSWPKNAIAPKCVITMKHGIPTIGVVHAKSITKEKSVWIVDGAENTIRANETNSRRLALALQWLQASSVTLKDLQRVPTDKPDLGLVQKRLAKLRSLDVYCVHFGVEPSKVMPFSGNGNDLNKWYNDINSDIIRIKAGFEASEIKTVIKAEEAALILLRDAFIDPVKQMRLDGSVHIVLDSKVSGGQVTHGVAIVIGSFGDF